jgi:hypothetical protein
MSGRQLHPAFNRGPQGAAVRQNDQPVIVLCGASSTDTLVHIMLDAENGRGRFPFANRGGRRLYRETSVRVGIDWIVSAIRGLGGATPGQKGMVER